MLIARVPVVDCLLALQSNRTLYYLMEGTRIGYRLQVTCGQETLHAAGGMYYTFVSKEVVRFLSIHVTLKK